MMDRDHLCTDVTQYHNPKQNTHVLKIDFSFRYDKPKQTAWLAVSPHPDKRKKKPRVASVYESHAEQLIRVYKLRHVNIGGSDL